MTINGSCKVIKVLLLFTYVYDCSFLFNIWKYLENILILFYITCYYESHSMLSSQHVLSYSFLAADILSFKFYALFIFQHLHSWEIFYVFFLCVCFSKCALNMCNNCFRMKLHSCGVEIIILKVVIICYHGNDYN